MNLRVMEKDDLPILVEWSNNLEFCGERSGLPPISKGDFEKWYDNAC